MRDRWESVPSGAAATWHRVIPDRIAAVRSPAGRCSRTGDPACRCDQRRPGKSLPFNPRARQHRAGEHAAARDQIGRRSPNAIGSGLGVGINGLSVRPTSKRSALAAASAPMSLALQACLPTACGSCAASPMSKVLSQRLHPSPDRSARDARSSRQGIRGARHAGNAGHGRRLRAEVGRGKQQDAAGLTAGDPVECHAGCCCR